MSKPSKVSEFVAESPLIIALWNVPIAEMTFSSIWYAMLSYMPSASLITRSISKEPPNTFKLTAFCSNFASLEAYSVFKARNAVLEGNLVCTYPYVNVEPPLGETALSNGNNSNTSECLIKE